MMNEEIGQKVFQQVIDLWVNPEIQRRKFFNKMPDNFELRKIQIVFSLDRGWNKVRFNNEVKAIAKCKLNKPKKKEEAIYEADIENIEKIELTDKDPNCAHITLLLFKNRWIVSFDFRYNKKRIQEHIVASKEFYESAKDNLSKNRLRPFYENAFASAELSAKSILLTLPNKNVLEGKNHEERMSNFEDWAKLGNTKQEYSNILNRLNNLRPSARYLCSTEFKKQDTKIIIEELKEMIDFTERSIE
jgi:uncharacterized protein (UPF0332 family)